MVFYFCSLAVLAFHSNSLWMYVVDARRCVFAAASDFLPSCPLVVLDAVLVRLAGSSERPLARPFLKVGSVGGTSHHYHHNVATAAGRSGT